MNARHDDALPEGGLLAAVDLGSNSFHLIIAKMDHGELRPVETLAEKVQLGAGLLDGRLSDDAIERGLDCLSRFAQLLQSIEPERLRVVGTNALRMADNRQQFTAPAQRILGARVNVIYGREEARLVYLGVAHTLADDAQSRLVIDIGGGSTELIVGERFEPKCMDSLQLGCVSWARSFFPDGKITRQNFRLAYKKAQAQVQRVQRRYHSGHWAECVGASGTLQAIETIIVQNAWSDGGIDRPGLAKLQDTLLAFDAVEAIELDGLSNARRNVIVPGVAITMALFDVLGISRMRSSKGALREGVIYDLLGRLRHEDVRERTVHALMQRYAVDSDMAEVVERRAQTLFTATRQAWQLEQYDGELLHWAALSHEIGIAIAYKNFRHHSAYLLRNADLPGFSQDEQEQLAILALGHRGKISADLFADYTGTELITMQRLVCLLRLAACFKYVESLAELPDFAVEATQSSLTLTFPAGWLAAHPLTAQDLEDEQATIARLGISLEFH